MNTYTRATMAAAAIATLFSLPIWGQTQSDKKERSPQHTKATAPPSDQIQPLNIKPGLWETTSTRSMSGAPPIPAEMLERLTPEQRARMEARMKANSAARNSSTTSKGCTTKEDLQQSKLKLDKECTPTIIASTSTVAKGTVSCESQGIKANGSVEVDVVDQEHLTGSIHSTFTMNDQTMNVDSAFTSKWLGSDCGNVK